MGRLRIGITKQFQKYKNYFSKEPGTFSDSFVTTIIQKFFLKHCRELNWKHNVKIHCTDERSNNSLPIIFKKTNFESCH